ncbi:uncharacterized protein LOC115626535 [Scaptodrosophila lebanonensis]|uniref:Uncharacterized protein LOC115626535 n=1 Tax=Drosophila lebanonensis TaxID=7225 RepID=A0A6J2TP01_DROLE|nr:uncharacterized protein LOC115626535 [Scaptodrosophila lebanonensis]
MLEFGYQQWPFAAPPLREKVYQSRPWYAVPQLVQPGNDRTFVPFAPSWEDDILHSEHNANIVVSLMERLRDFHKMKKLSNYMIKTVVLTELAEGDLDWDQSLDIIFVAVWEKLIQHLNNGKLGRFLSPQYNLFVDMSAVDVEKYYYTANKILQQIKKLQGVEEVTFDNVNNIFFNW